ncbi:MAG: hypothetical protein KJZ80_00035 [Hyphomicrobiaceae bacterium]|nr:hypothetical protein [Hyphomicrobiaceae bacterium]
MRSPEHTGRRRAWRRLAAPAAAASLLAVAHAAGTLAQTPATDFTPQEETPEQYPEGPNRDDAFYSCTACHGFRIVAAQGMSRARWDETLTWMTERHNMPEIAGEDRDKVLDYLERAFPEQQRARGGWKNPFAPQ